MDTLQTYDISSANNTIHAYPVAAMCHHCRRRYLPVSSLDAVFENPFNCILIKRHRVFEYAFEKLANSATIFGVLKTAGDHGKEHSCFGRINQDESFKARAHLIRSVQYRSKGTRRVEGIICFFLWATMVLTSKDQKVVNQWFIQFGIGKS